jgi:predicted nucleic acid-binding protein
VVSAAVLLDAGPLGLLSNPRRSAAASAGRKWLDALSAAGRRVIVPEIADYEVRRELLRVKRLRGIANLDQLARQLEYLPLTTTAMRTAAELWAAARQQGQPTAADGALDADVILAAQALTLGTPDVVVATMNVGHLSRFVPAEAWQNIIP